MIFRRTFGATLLLCLLSGPLPAAAGAPAIMPLGAATKQPIGHYGFCLRDPAQCRPAASNAALPAVLDPGLIKLVAQINTQANAEIKPASDDELYGVEEFWALPDGRGDCEDYALLKRARLQAAGIPLSDLLLTVVRKTDGTGHAVLTLRTTAGDFVLDNLDWRVRLWTETPYRFVKRQSSADPGLWVSIDGDADPLVSAVSR